MHMLIQFSTETSRQVNKLMSVTCGHARVADHDSVSYQALLSQRWKLQRQQDSISQKMKVIQQIMTSLAPMPSCVKGSDANKDQMPRPEDRTYTNLVSFLCCSRRVVSLHRRSHSHLFEFHPRPLHLGASPAIPLIIMPSSQLTTADTNSDTSLDMFVQTPVVTDSLMKQQAHLMIGSEEVGTATIFARILPNLTPPDPSDVKIKLPDYVHELLTKFDVGRHNLVPSGTTLRFKPNETHKTEVRKHRFWSFRRPSKDQVPSIASQPEFLVQSSSGRLSQFMSIPETPTLRKADTRGEEPKTSVSEVDSRDESNNSIRNPTSPNKVIGRMTSKIARRISFAS